MIKREKSLDQRVDAMSVRRYEQEGGDVFVMCDEARRNYCEGRDEGWKGWLVWEEQRERS